jgi:hypothetical protein
LDSLLVARLFRPFAVAAKIAQIRLLSPGDGLKLGAVPGVRRGGTNPESEVPAQDSGFDTGASPRNDREIN